MPAVVADLEELRESFREFTQERDWARFHDPKSLLLALVGEVGEVAELYQWIPADDAVAREHGMIRSRQEQPKSSLTS